MLGELTSTDVRVVAREPGYCFAAWRQAYIIDFRDTPTIASIDASVRCKGEVLAANPTGIVVVNLVPGDLPLPSAEVREHAAAKQDEDLRGVLAHATIVLGQGFRAGTFRSMLTGLHLVSRSSLQRKVFSDAGSAALWLAKIIDAPRAWTTGLTAAVERVRTS